MSSVSFADFEQDPAKYIENLVLDRTRLRVTRQNAPSVVIMAEEEYEILMETVLLKRSSVNAKRLCDSIKNADDGILEEHTPPKKPGTNK